MEFEGSDGSKTQLQPNSTTVFGRANQSNTKNLSISRRHVSFDIISTPNLPNSQTTPSISFEVLGKNPIWVYSKNGDKKVHTFKRFQRGQLCFDDSFCISGKNPVWFTLKKVENDTFGNSPELGGKINAELSQSLESNDEFDYNDDFEFDYIDVSHIDPVQEFGFLVIGHEFDQYPKKMIRHIKNWDWFLEDPVGNSDVEDTNNRKGKMGGKRKRKNTSASGRDNDEEWAAESEGEELTTQAMKTQKAKYNTRSKDSGISGSKKSSRKSSTSAISRAEEEVSENEDDEEDETLGGFIVDDETAEEVEENEIEEDDEEEFVEDEDELED